MTIFDEFKSLKNNFSLRADRSIGRSLALHELFGKICKERKFFEILKELVPSKKFDQKFPN